MGLDGDHKNGNIMGIETQYKYTNTDLYTVEKKILIYIHQSWSGIHQSVSQWRFPEANDVKNKPHFFDGKIAPIFHGDDWGIVVVSHK